MIDPTQLVYREPKKKKFRVPKKKDVIVSIIFFFGVTLGAGGIFAYQYYMNKPVPVAATEELPDKPPPQEVLGLIETVETSVPDIPKNEYPSIATIDDVSKLSDQAFFDGAKEGDKLMIYTVSKRAILYRPDTKQVVRQAPVEVVGDKEEVSSSSSVLSASDSGQPALRIKY